MRDSSAPTSYRLQLSLPEGVGLVIDGLGGFDVVQLINGVAADPHYTWGWITGTVYFNKAETRMFNAFGTAAAFIASLGGPWSVLLRGYVAYLMSVAQIAQASGRCLKVKSTLSAGAYSGGYCK